MVRITLLLILVAVVVYWLSRPSSVSQHAERKQGRSWLKAGGLLGALILLSKLFHLPLATLLRLLPFMVSSFRRAASAQEQYQKQHAHSQGMSREEASLILGVSQQATKEEIQKAHRKLIVHNHPDKGGNDYLAAKINEARDTLLN